MARENTETVRQNLASRGFHIQFPPQIFDLQDADAGRPNG
ncbi:MAG: hypothetical protein ACREO0_05185 [Pseudoxanthomonas sp.]